VLKLLSFTCWLLLASMANGSVSTHSFAGTSADSWVYTRMLNTVGSSMIGKNVTVDTICLSIERISAWISASGLLDCALCHDQCYVQRSDVAVKRNSLSHRSLGRLPDKIDIKDPPLERHSRIFGYNCYNELRYRPRKQPCCHHTLVTVWAEMTGLLLICFNILETV
jgi:hypothetical protein